MIEDVYQRADGVEECFDCKQILLPSLTPWHRPMTALMQGLERLGFTMHQDLSEGDLCVVSSGYEPRRDLGEFFRIEVNGVSPDLPDSSEVYDADIVFMSHKPHNSLPFYLPFGILEEYLELGEDRPWAERRYDFAAIYTGGEKQRQLSEWLRLNKLPGRVFNAACDNPWKVLNDTKFLIYPGRSSDKWDSDMPWKAMAAGCIVLMEKPPIDMGQYPLTDIAFTYDGLPIKLNYDPSESYEKMRSHVSEQARRYFTPVPLARYFLRKIWDYRRLVL